MLVGTDGILGRPVNQELSAALFNLQRKRWD
jgi:hypothetical protein